MATRQHLAGALISRTRFFVYLVLLLVYMLTLYIILWYLNCFGYLIIAVDYSHLSPPENLSRNDGDGVVRGATSMSANKEFPLYKADRSQVKTDLNVFLTVKTTPKNYKIRIGMSKMTWFQKVDRRMVSL